MSRVAIIGSCITRDLWPILGDAVSDLLYVSRTSLPSLFAAPVSGLQIATSPPEPLKRHQHNAVVRDLKKTALEALVRHRPTHLIFDFIDERFDLLATQTGLVTHSWELEVSGYLSQPGLASATPVARMSPVCDQLWADGLRELCAFLRATPLRDATLILHDAQWAKRYLNDQGLLVDFAQEIDILNGRSGQLSAHNAILERYNRVFADATGAAQVRAAETLRVGDSGHQWGLSPFHYSPDYYRDIWRQLRALGV